MRLAFILMLAVMPACGCLGRIYTPGDKSMVSGARDSNRRVDAKLEAFLEDWAKDQAYDPRQGMGQGKEG